MTFSLEPQGDLLTRQQGLGGLGGCAIRTRIPDFVKRVQKIGKDSIERQGVQLSCIVKRRI